MNEDMRLELLEFLEMIFEECYLTEKQAKSLNRLIAKLEAKS